MDTHITIITMHVLVSKQSKEFCYLLHNCLTRSRDSSVGIATSYKLNGRGVGVRVPVGARFFYSLHVARTGSGAYTAYPVGTGGSFPGNKAAEE
jgi:hypothetical protein